MLSLSALELNDVRTAIRLTVDESNRASPHKLRTLSIQHLEGEDDVTSLEDAGMSL